jgi:hypothetical protein
MSDYRNYIKQYTAADIQRYLDGQMNATEMHAMEKAALEDPFLADAIEGLEESKKEFNNESINANLQQLRNQIAEKANTGKVRALTSFRWWRVASAAIVLIVFGAITYTYLKPKADEQLIVVNDKKPASIEPSAAPPDKTITKDNDTFFEKDNSASEEEVKRANTVTEKKEDIQIDKSANRGTASAPSVAIKDDNARAFSYSQTDREKEAATVKDSIDTDAALARNKKLTEYEPQRKATVSDKDLVIVNPDKKQKEKSELEPVVIVGYGAQSRKDVTSSNQAVNFFNGRVTDINNRPIANATVQLANTRNGYTTDQYGYFKIPSTDTSVKVTISGVGFDVQTIQLRNDLAINRIQLQPSSGAFNEVVVTKPAANAKREKSNYKTKYPSVLIQDAEPANGWIEFDKYIESNKRTNPDDPNIKTGEVVVSFLVNRKSELSDFKIEQRLSVAQDAEAIRLIKEGPSWRLLKGKKARIMVIIRF